MFFNEIPVLKVVQADYFESNHINLVKSIILPGLDVLASKLSYAFGRNTFCVLLYTYSVIFRVIIREKIFLKYLYFSDF